MTASFRFLTCLLISALVCTTANAANEDLSDAIASDYEQNLNALFIHFHQNPELSNLEFETARRLAAEDQDNPTPHHSPLFKIEPGPSVRAGVEASVLATMALMPPQ